MLLLSLLPAKHRKLSQGLRVVLHLIQKEPSASDEKRLDRSNSEEACLERLERHRVSRPGRWMV